MLEYKFVYNYVSQRSCNLHVDPASHSSDSSTRTAQWPSITPYQSTSSATWSSWQGDGEWASSTHCTLIHLYLHTHPYLHIRPHPAHTLLSTHMPLPAHTSRTSLWWHRKAAISGLQSTPPGITPVTKMPRKTYACRLCSKPVTSNKISYSV